MREPEPGTVERWAWDFIVTTSLEVKLAPPSPPARWEAQPHAARLDAPGRPAELCLVAKAPKTRGLSTPTGRARALHTFLHHELQAAELMAWALLAFPDTPREFRAGLVRIALDEVRHMSLYARQIERLGYRVGSFPVRDWFWERIPCVRDPGVVRRRDGPRPGEREPGAHGLVRGALPRGGRRGRRARPGGRGARRDRARPLRGALVRRVHGWPRLRQMARSAPRASLAHADAWPHSRA